MMHQRINEMLRFISLITYYLQTLLTKMRQKTYLYEKDDVRL